MVNIGDTVEVAFQARDSLTDFRAYYDPFSELPQRLAAAGFRVVDMSGPRGAFAGLTWDSYRVVVVPLTSAYADVQDIAGIVAGAAEQIGLQVDNPNARGTVIAFGPGNSQPATTGDYENNYSNTLDQNKGQGFLAELAASIGISETTLGLGLAAVIVGAVLLITRK